jgi:hypothetical protein
MIKTCSNKISISVLLSVWLIANSHAIANETYPTRHVTIVAPFAAGSGTDTAARIIAQILQDGLGQPSWWRTGWERMGCSPEARSRAPNPMVTLCSLQRVPLTRVWIV